MRPSPIYNLDEMELDFDNPVYNIEQIREINPQRHEMEQLTAILHLDEENSRLLGYKDLTEDEFWVRGHMPGYPLMPGVVMCECGAQLGGFLARKQKLLPGDFLGFGGMSDVRFRRPIPPPCRLILMARVVSVKARIRAEFEFQGYVDGKLVFNGTMIGVPIVKES